MTGRILKGRINTEQKTIFGVDGQFDYRIGPANRAFAFFSLQCSAARAAVDTWCLIALERWMRMAWGMAVRGNKNAEVQ